MTLREVLDAAAAGVGVHPDTGPDGIVTWAIGTRVFAWLDAAGRSAAFRLDPVLASAARRTPDTAGSDRGLDWVAFAPRAVDAHAADRATAWFAAAARRAES